MSAWISEGELMKEATNMEDTTGERARPPRGVQAGTVYRTPDDPESDCVVVLHSLYNK